MKASRLPSPNAAPVDEESRVPCLVQRPGDVHDLGDRKAFQRSGCGAARPAPRKVPLWRGMTSPAPPIAYNVRARVPALPGPAPDQSTRMSGRGASVASVSRSANSVKPASKSRATTP